MSKSRLRHAATLLIACGRDASVSPYPRSKIGCNYDVIMLKRSSKSSFMPSVCVFPGGAYDITDGSTNWMNLFTSAGIPWNSLNYDFRLADSHRSETYSRLAARLNGDPQDFDYSSQAVSQDVLHNRIISHSKNATAGISDSGSGGAIPEVALRITALRETFEETGLLLGVVLCNGKVLQPLALTEEGPLILGGQNPDTDTTAFIDSLPKSEQFAQWREIVRKEPGRFVELFSSCGDSPHSFLPWVWGLGEWWGWLTPEKYTGVRYDTMFYTAILRGARRLGSLSPCNESSELLLSPPDEIWKDWQRGNVFFGPPQVYEMSRLLHGGANLEALEANMKQRGVRHSAPVDTWLPQILACRDGAVSLLPGDVLYSDQYRLVDNAPPALDCSIEQLRQARSLYGDEQERSLYGHEECGGPPTHHRLEMKTSQDIGKTAPERRDYSRAKYNIVADAVARWRQGGPDTDLLKPDALI